MNIAALRTEMGLSQEAFAQLIGLASKGNVSIIERENRCGLNVALAIESLSGGRINAADLNDDVRKSRAALEELAHAAASTAPANSASPGKAAADSPRSASSMGEAA